MIHKTAFLVVGISCLSLAAAGEKETAPRQAKSEVVGADQSDSIATLQLGDWAATLKKRVRGMCPGSRLQIYGIDDRTFENKRFFDSSLPLPPPPGAVLDEITGIRTRIDRFRSDAAQAITAAFVRKAASRATDIFSLFDRIVIEAGRALKILLFTDGLHVTAELNLERTALTDATIPALVEKVATGHSWTARTLAGADVEFVLPSPDRNGVSPGPNDRRILNRFYAQLVGRMGGKLTSFESDMKNAGGCNVDGAMDRSGRN